MRPATRPIQTPKDLDDAVQLETAREWANIDNWDTASVMCPPTTYTASTKWYLYAQLIARKFFPRSAA